MKKIVFLALAFVTLAASGQKASDIRIYLNAGHGSWGPNDRPMATIPYPMTLETGRPDTCGFYESNTNLWKVLKLGNKLIENGFQRKNIVYSRTATGPYPYVAGAANEEKYNRPLSEICEEVEAGNFDMFLSVHSNAAAEGAIANYPLFLYRGHDSGYGSVPGSKAMASAMWPDLMSNGIDIYTSYSPTNPNIRGDIDFMHDSLTTRLSNGKWYTGYYGVLRHGTPGFLSEGYFHTYQPARHRALNQDYCGQEGVRYLRGILKYFNLPGEKVGYIMGTVKDSKYTISHSLYKYASNSSDQWFPINGATVRLLKNGEEVATYTTDNNYNGVFVFSDLEPGTYTLDCSAPNYNNLAAGFKTSFTVKANATTYKKLSLVPKSNYKPTTPTIATNYTNGMQNDYAYSLTQSPSTGYRRFAFTPTSSAKCGKIVLHNLKLDSTIVYPITTITDGRNLIDIPDTLLPPGEYSWAVEIENEPITKPTAFFRFDKTSAGTGVAVNTDPKSIHFGKIFYADGYTSNGIYALNPNLKSVNSTAYFKSYFVGAGESPGRLAINPNNNYVYVADATTNHSGIFYFNPSATTQLNNFFSGSRGSNGRITYNGTVVGGSTTGLTFTGTGGNTKLFAYIKNYPSDGSYLLSRFDVGTQNVWSKTATAKLSSPSQLMLNRNVSLCGDTTGLFFSQIRYSGNNTSNVPSFGYLSLMGTVLFNSGTSLTSLNGSNAAGLAMNKSRTLLAVADGNSAIKVYRIKWVGSRPSFTYRCSIPSNCGAIYQIAFDYADNIFFSARSGNMGYAIPLDSYVHSTPARTNFIIKDLTGINTTEMAPENEKLAIDFDGNLLTVECPVPSAHVSVYSSDGSLLMKERAAEGQAVFQTSQLPKGIYIIRAESPDHQRWSAKVAK